MAVEDYLVALADHVAQHAFGGEHHVHEPRAFARLEFGHFTDVPVEYDPAKTRIVLVVHQYHPAKIVLPKQQSAVSVAQFALHDR